MLTPNKIERNEITKEIKIEFVDYYNRKILEILLTGEDAEQLLKMLQREYEEEVI